MTNKKTVFIPLRDRVLLEIIEEDSISKGGLYIPEQAKDKPQRGRVIAKGKGKYLKDNSLQPIDCELGDVVLYHKYAGADIELNGTKHLILEESDILGVL